MADRWYLIGSMEHARIVFASRPGLASLCQEMLETAPSCAVRLSGEGKRSRYTIYRAENRVAPSEIVVRKRCNNCGHRAGEFCGLPDGMECDGAKCWVPEKAFSNARKAPLTKPFDENGLFTCPLCGEHKFTLRTDENCNVTRCSNVACYYSWRRSAPQAPLPTPVREPDGRWSCPTSCAFWRVVRVDQCPATCEFIKARNAKKERS